MYKEAVMSKVPNDATKRKRGNRGMGRLFKKANGKTYPADSKAKGNYYLTWYAYGSSPCSYNRITAP